jgi:hypothetical protein
MERVGKMRCDYCGYDEKEALANHSYMCAPPFEVCPHEFTGLHPADKLKPLDTSELGPIRVEPNQDAARAKIVKDAIREIANNSLFTYWDDILTFESDTNLAKLGRMLRG